VCLPFFSFLPIHSQRCAPSIFMGEKKMQKNIFLFLCLAALIVLAGCGVTTITEQPGNFFYGGNDEIQILDIDTRDTLGTLTIHGMSIITDEPFVLSEEEGTDESGNPTYEDVSYEALVQIDYSYKREKRGAKSISASNFTVLDSKGKSGRINPDADYDRMPQKGDQSFVVALKNKSSTIQIHFDYNLFQSKPTAKIQIGVGEDSGTEIKSETSTPKENTASETSSSEEFIPAQNSSTKAPDSAPASGTSFSYVFLILVAFLVLIIMILLVVIIVLAAKK